MHRRIGRYRRSKPRKLTAPLKLIGVWPGGVMVKVLACDTTGRGFDSRPFHFPVTTLGKLFTHTCLCHQAV